MESRRHELREYHLGVLLLIMVHELATVNCLPPSVVPSSSKTTKFTEISPKKLSKNFNVDQRKQNCSSFEFSKVSPSTVYPSTETRNPKIENETKTVNSGCSNEQWKGTECPRFVHTYSSFYLKIGGWLMLGIVLAGIIALVVTHYLGMRNMRRPQRRELSRILWVEALTKSKLARFV